LQFALQKTKITIIACAGTIFTESIIVNNPGFWFEMSMIIFLISTIGITFYCFDYQKIFMGGVNFHTNFKVEFKNEAVDNKQKVETDEDNLEVKVSQEQTIENVESKPDYDNWEYKNNFMKFEVNQGTADFLTPDELVKFDERSHLKYLLDTFLTRHEIGKVFFLPNIYIPKYLALIFLVQTISIKFALNAILYDDTLINQRNKLEDNVYTYNHSIPLSIC
jgi:hypothetical protein